jgi:hypothetical protein
MTNATPNCGVPTTPKDDPSYYRAEIHGQVVTARYMCVVFSKKRGLISQHKTPNGAARMVAQEEYYAEVYGRRSDAAIYIWHRDGGWSPLIRMR